MNAGRGRWLLVAALSVVALANVAALAGAAYNRGGTPESTLDLSERELGMGLGSGDAEDSALAVRLEYLVANGADLDSPALPSIVGWLDAAKLAELGIRGPRPRPASVRYPMPWASASHEVLLVLEFDGPAYRQAVENACAPHAAEAAMAAAGVSPRPDRSEVAARLAELGARRCTQARERDSRLFVVDAGRDPTALRARYPDRAHYAIARGMIEVSSRLEGGVAQVSARVGRLQATTIHVPRSLRAVFETASAGDRGRQAGRTAAQLAFGRRLEPWLLEARAVD